MYLVLDKRDAKLYQTFNLRRGHILQDPNKTIVAKTAYSCETELMVRNYCT